MAGCAEANSRAAWQRSAPSASGSSPPLRPQHEPAIESRHDNTIENAFAKLKALLRKAARSTAQAELAAGRAKAPPASFGARCRAILSSPPSDVYRPRFVRRRIESYAASAASQSWFCRMAAGV